MTNYLLLLNITKIVISRIYPKKISYKIKESEIANSLPCHIILNYFIFFGKHDERFNGITFFPQEPPYLLTFPIYWEIKLYRLQRLL